MTNQQQQTSTRFSGLMQHVKESVERVDKNEELVINFIQDLALKGYTLKEYAYVVRATSEPVLTAVMCSEDGDFTVRPSLLDSQTLIVTGVGLDPQVPEDEESTLIISLEKSNYNNKVSTLTNLKPPTGRDLLTAFAFYLLNQRIQGYQGHTITGLAVRTTSKGALAEFKIDNESHSLILHPQNEHGVTPVAYRGDVTYLKFPQQILNWVLKQSTKLN